MELYGKVHHLWQVDMGEELPLGKPKLMTSLTAANQFEFEKVVGERDARFGTNWKRKRDLREGIKEPLIHLGECLQQFLGNKKLTDDVDANYTWNN